MSPVIPFRRRSSLPNLPVALWAVALAVFAFAATTIVMNWQSGPVQQIHVQVLRPTPTQSGQIDVIDGDTVRFQGVVYRLSGFDAPEVGDKAAL